jgi:hypothetical protein
MSEEETKGKQLKVEDSEAQMPESELEKIVKHITELIQQLPPDSQHKVFSAFGSKPDTDSKKGSVSQQDVKPSHSDLNLGEAAAASSSGIHDAGKDHISHPPVVAMSSVPYHGQSEIPRLPLFSGDRNNKSEVSYTIWRYDVVCLNEDKLCSSSVLLQAIRKSVRGMAADMLLTLGTHVTTDELISKFDTIFGNVRSAHQLTEDFYVARQKSDETVAQWGGRLQELGSKISQAGTISSTN